jgi:hypothetical protein
MDPSNRSQLAPGFGIASSGKRAFPSRAEDPPEAIATSAPPATTQPPERSIGVRLFRAVRIQTGEDWCIPARSLCTFIAHGERNLLPMHRADPDAAFKIVRPDCTGARSRSGTPIAPKTILISLWRSLSLNAPVEYSPSRNASSNERRCTGNAWFGSHSTRVP